MHDILRSIIREVLEEIEREDIDEFSGVAALGGGPATPLGTDAYYPDSRVGKKKKVDEASTVASSVSGDSNRIPSEEHIFQDKEFNVSDEDKRSFGKLSRSRDQSYLDSVEALARSFGGSPSPFASIRHARKNLAHKH